MARKEQCEKCSRYNIDDNFCTFMYSEPPLNDSTCDYYKMGEPKRRASAPAEENRPAVEYNPKPVEIDTPRPSEGERTRGGLSPEMTGMSLSDADLTSPRPSPSRPSATTVAGAAAGALAAGALSGGESYKPSPSPRPAPTPSSDASSNSRTVPMGGEPRPTQTAPKPAEPLKKQKLFSGFLSPSGRIRRLEFGLFMLGYMGVFVILFDVFKLDDPGVEMPTYLLLIYLFLFYLFFAQRAKRCHDIGISGWFQLIPFIDILLLLKDGQRMANRWGQDPKAGE